MCSARSRTSSRAIPRSPSKVSTSSEASSTRRPAAGTPNRSSERETPWVAPSAFRASRPSRLRDSPDPSRVNRLRDSPYPSRVSPRRVSPYPSRVNRRRDSPRPSRVNRLQDTPTRVSRLVRLRASLLRPPLPGSLDPQRPVRSRTRCPGRPRPRHRRVHRPRRRRALRSVRLPPDPGRGVQAWASLISARTVPLVTVSPTAARSPLITPPLWALIGCSIFIASRTMTV